VAKFVVVGGVAAGAAAATRARRMDESAEIVILERSGYVSFANCGLPYYAGGEIADRDDLLVATPASLKASLNLDVRVGHEALSIDRQRKVVRVRDLEKGTEYEEAYDKLLLAPGASPIQPPIDGVDAPNVHVLRQVEDVDRLKAQLEGETVQHVTIVGAGFIGLEAAEALRSRGLEVDVLELMPQVLPPLDADMAMPLAQALVRNGVKLRLGSGLESLAVEGGSVSAVVTTHGDRIETDLVLLSIGVRPSSALAREAGLSIDERGAIEVDEFLRTNDPDIFAAGDVIKPEHVVAGQRMPMPLAGPAAKHGRLVGEQAVTGRQQPAARVAGTAIVRVFDEVAAVAGLTMSAAARLGMSADYVVIQRPHHVTYYPGAEPMRIKLVFAPETGKVLGAQIVGGAGVDRRIDVVAAVLHFGGTVDDLAQLDLAYAPQFGAAKDAIHIAANVAQNQRAGLIEHTHPGEAEALRAQGWRIVDVRQPAMVAAGAIPGAECIPLAALRTRVEELRGAPGVLVYCNVGQTSYMAARVLSQKGIHPVRSLAGGFTWYASQGLPIAAQA
jgi:NADPH-dependent 2,4-dienoyl-CoA reductase/sulfur reductase-like enzyme/rhodanese-related sulfurtransferase